MHWIQSITYTLSQVWDAETGKGIGNYTNHMSRIGCLLWSPVDPDVVLTGSEDCSLRGWKVSNLTDKLPKKKGRTSNYTLFEILDLSYYVFLSFFIRLFIDYV